MKRIIKELSLVLILALMACGIFTGCGNDTESSESDYVFAQTQFGSVLIEYNGEDEAPIVPSFVEGSPVIAIGNYAFADNTSVKQIYFSQYVRAIGKNAFEGCHSLETIMISDGIEYIGENAFAGCDKAEIYCQAGEDIATGWENNWNVDGITVYWNSSQGADDMIPNGDESFGFGDNSGVMDMQLGAPILKIVPMNAVIHIDQIEIDFNFDAQVNASGSYLAPYSFGINFNTPKPAIDEQDRESSSSSSKKEIDLSQYYVPTAEGMKQLLELLSSTEEPNS